MCWWPQVNLWTMNHTRTARAFVSLARSISPSISERTPEGLGPTARASGRKLRRPNG